MKLYGAPLSRQTPFENPSAQIALASFMAPTGLVAHEPTEKCTAPQKPDPKGQTRCCGQGRKHFSTQNPHMGPNGCVP